MGKVIDVGRRIGSAPGDAGHPGMGELPAGRIREATTRLQQACCQHAGDAAVPLSPGNGQSQGR